ncbi:hypothetical protein SK128_015103, partial [Halocaridina rubra]
TDTASNVDDEESRSAEILLQEIEREYMIQSETDTEKEEKVVEPEVVQETSVEHDNEEVENTALLDEAPEIAVERGNIVKKALFCIEDLKEHLWHVRDALYRKWKVEVLACCNNSKKC